MSISSVCSARALLQFRQRLVGRGARSPDAGTRSGRPVRRSDSRRRSVAGECAVHFRPIGGLLPGKGVDPPARPSGFARVARCVMPAWTTRWPMTSGSASGAVCPSRTPAPQARHHPERAHSSRHAHQSSGSMLGSIPRVRPPNRWPPEPPESHAVDRSSRPNPSPRRSIGLRNNTIQPAWRYRGRPLAGMSRASAIHYHRPPPPAATARCQDPWVRCGISSTATSISANR